MSNSAIYHYFTSTCALGAMLLLIACSSSKPYTLVAQLPSGPQQGRVLAATIDVDGLACNVRIMLLNSNKAWAPVCFVKQDHPNFKSFLIANQQVDIGTVGDGFQVLNSMVPTLPAPQPNISTTTSKGVNNPPASPTTDDSSFPNEWSQSSYPGHVVLQGQNTGYLVTKATLTINGSQGMLDVTYKTGYVPLHIECTVLANQHGDFTLIFNPAELNKLSPGANYNISLTSESAGISGNIWDSRGFDTWTPSLSPQWVAASSSD
ncbi:MAG TPA: hypothetical protein VNF48_04865 [Gammaproteobacteria bacterium]|nr:hypothetical protein [Gammaproteobacteria bacterium]